MGVREAFNTGGPVEAFNMGDPMNSANTIVRYGLTWESERRLTWVARQRRLKWAGVRVLVA